MLTIEIHKKETHLDELMRLLATTREIILTEDSTPVARLISIEPAKAPRIAGLHAGSTWVSDDFDDPLPDEFWLGEG
jgi:antitoxin (DNA-binding transcriptional repressor) of toxin-antitoxin stability system